MHILLYLHILEGHHVSGSRCLYSRQTNSPAMSVITALSRSHEASKGQKHTVIPNGPDEIWVLHDGHEERSGSSLHKQEEGIDHRPERRLDISANSQRGLTRCHHVADFQGAHDSDRFAYTQQDRCG